jgi:hypothetical protein
MGSNGWVGSAIGQFSLPSERIARARVSNRCETLHRWSSPRFGASRPKHRQCDRLDAVAVSGYDMDQVCCIRGLFGIWMVAIRRPGNPASIYEISKRRLTLFLSIRCVVSIFHPRGSSIRGFSGLAASKGKLPSRLCLAKLGLGYSQPHHSFLLSLRAKLSARRAECRS